MSGDLFDELSAECLMGRVRMLSRFVTRLFDDELRPFGLKANQFNLLVVIAKFGPIRRADIGRLIHADASTMTRNLRSLIVQKWIEEVDVEEDQRGSSLRMTASGRKLLEEAAPAWRRAQAATMALLGESGVSAVRGTAARLLNRQLG